MGFPEAKSERHCAFRGLASHPDGQPFESTLNQIYLTEQRAGFLPISPTKVYWFVCYNRASLGPKITDGTFFKEATELVKDWPSDLLNIIENTPRDTIIGAPLVYPCLWPSISPLASAGRIVLVGDAWHPMTPNLEQGACTLEDAEVLVRKLAGAIKSGPASIEDALSLYGSDKWLRIFLLTVCANLLGSLLQWEHPVVCFETMSSSPTS